MFLARPCGRSFVYDEDQENNKMSVEKIGDPLLMFLSFGGSESRALLRWLSALEATRLQRVSKFWRRESSAEMEARRRWPCPDRCAVALCVREGELRSIVALKQLLAVPSWVPDVCLVFMRCRPRSAKRRAEALAKALPRDCLVSIVVGSGCIGPDGNGRNVEFQDEDSVSIMLLRTAAGILAMSPGSEPQPALAEELSDEWTNAIVSVGLICGKSHHHRKEETRSSEDARILESLKRRIKVDYDHARERTMLCVEAWMDELEDPTSLEFPTSSLHLVFETADSRRDVEHGSLWQGKRGPFVAGGLCSKVFGGRGHHILDCETLLLTLGGASHKAVALVDHGQGLDYELEAKRALFEKAKLSTTNPPDFGFTVVCSERGADFHGTDMLEAQVHNRLLPAVPIVGFFADGEIGPTGNDDGAGGHPSFNVHFVSTCLAFVTNTIKETLFGKKEEKTSDAQQEPKTTTRDFR